MTSDAPLQLTVFHDWHVAHGGRMVEFGGWHMPVQYSTIVEEHTAVRSTAGVFDISHMGRLRFSGPDAVRFLDHIVTNDVASIPVGRIRYALITNEAGHVLDDVLVYRFEDHCVLVVNASNRLKILAWIEQHRGGFEVEIRDCTPSHGMVAIQGPRSSEIMAALECPDADSLKYYSAAAMNVLGLSTLVSRTGYTGEDGFEIIVELSDARCLWDAVIERGAASSLQPCGLGCRDTLRLEAAMPLYGHELSESINPFEVGLQFAVKLDGGEFIGRDALRVVRDAGPARMRIGLELQGRRIAREGSAVLADGRRIGEVTSGTFSPTLEKSIAMALVEIGTATVGETLAVDIRGRQESATVVTLPFYRR